MCNQNANNDCGCKKSLNQDIEKLNTNNKLLKMQLEDLTESVLEMYTQKQDKNYMAIVYLKAVNIKHNVLNNL